MSTRGGTRIGPDLASGFTMVELGVTVAVAAILAAIAIPSFITTINTNRLAGLSNELVASMQAARMQAVRRNAHAVFCRSTDGTSCSTGATWTGWLVYVDANRNGALDAGEVVQVGTVKSPLQIRVSPAITNSMVVFRPDGIAKADTDAVLQASIAVCIPTSKPRENQRNVNIFAGSRFSVTQVVAATCTAPANP